MKLSTLILTLSFFAAGANAQVQKIVNPKIESVFIDAKSDVANVCAEFGYNENVDFSYSRSAGVAMSIVKIDSKMNRTYSKKYSTEYIDIIYCKDKILDSFKSYEHSIDSQLEVSKNNFQMRYELREAKRSDIKGSIYNCFVRGLKTNSIAVETIGTAKFRALVTSDGIIPSCNQLVKKNTCVKRNKRGACRRYEENLVSENVCTKNITNSYYKGFVSDYIVFDSKKNEYVNEISHNGFKVNTTYVVTDDLNLTGEVSIKHNAATNLPDAVARPNNKLIGHVQCLRQAGE